MTDLANVWRFFMIFHVFKMFNSENIAIFAILLRYFDILVISFVILLGYCISVFERYCTSAVNTYILPSPIYYPNTTKDKELQSYKSFDMLLLTLLCLKLLICFSFWHLYYCKSQTV